jgi:hypothetical protein
MSQPSGKHFCCIFRRSWILNVAQTGYIKTFCSSAQFLQANAKIIPQLQPPPHPSTFLPIHYSITVHDSTSHEPPNTLFSKLQKDLMTGWMIQRYSPGSRDKTFFSSTKTSRIVLGLTQAPIQWVPGPLSSGKVAKA